MSLLKMKRGEFNNLPVKNNELNDCIGEAGTRIQSSALTHSLIGNQAQIEGVGAAGHPAIVNVGDNSRVK